MLDINQGGLLRYEERVRLERANGLRKEDQCESDGCGCTPHNEDNMVGMDYATLAKTPLKLSAVCPHTKVVIPVSPAYVVKEPVKEIVASYPVKPYQVVDYNPCDGRTGVLKVLETDTNLEVKHASTVQTHTTEIKDTIYDDPNEVKVVTQDIQIAETVEQPLATNGTESDITVTKDGKTSTKKNPQVERVEE